MFVPITWIGRRRVRMTDGPNNVLTGPVRIRRNAIGDAMPDRDVLLAPDHALYLDGTLYLARQLINRASILREPGMRIAEYWGVQLERHNVVLANNLAIESLLAKSAAAYLPVAGTVERSGNDAQERALADLPAHVSMPLPWLRRWMLAHGHPTPNVPTPQSPAPEPSPPQSSTGTIELASEALTILRGLAGMAADHHVRLQIAAQPQLRLRIGRAAFQTMVTTLLRRAIQVTPGGGVLLSATHQAGFVHIAVLDEATGAPSLANAAELAEMRAATALQGGHLDVNHRSGEGTTVLLRLPAATAQ